MQTIKSLLVTITSVSLLLFSCQKFIDERFYKDNDHSETYKKNSAGYVYTLSNQTTDNKVLVYSRTANGTISYLSSFSTGGTGTGSGLGNQQAVVLSEKNDFLLAVNAGSNSITSFKVSGGTLIWKSTVASEGTLPVSITVHKDLVYVLNAGGTGNISGFRLHEDGTLHKLTGSTKPLSSSMAGAAQISFVADGGVLAITEKATNKIITYRLDAMGKPNVMHSITSSTPTPFGFAVGKEGIIYVSEAAGGTAEASVLSSYRINGNGTIKLLDGSVGAGQTAACWVVITNNGKYIYDTNTGSNNLSSFTTNKGDLSVLKPIAAATGPGTSPIDAALSANSKFLYVLNSGNESISVFVVENDGELTYHQTLSGLPNGATGMAAK